MGIDESLQLGVRVEPARCARGATARATVTLRNRGTAPVDVEFPSSQRLELVLADAAGAERWRWSEGRFFAMMLGLETLGPGEAWEWDEEVPAPAEAGRYVLRATVASPDVARVAEAALEVAP